MTYAPGNRWTTSLDSPRFFFKMSSTCRQHLKLRQETDSMLVIISQARSQEEEDDERTHLVESFLIHHRILCSFEDGDGDRLDGFHIGIHEES